MDVTHNAIKHVCECLCRNPAHFSASEWDEIVQEAVRHRVASLLYYRLKSTQTATAVPPATLQQLQHAYLFTVAKNTYFSTMLSKILEAFHQEHIKVIVLKGAFLEAVTYGNMGLRMMNDIDLLVKKEKLAHSQQILQQIDGFNSSYPYPIDMHWNIDLSAAELQIEMDELWNRAQPVVIAGIEALGLSFEDVLLHLCIHQAFHHSFQFAPLRTLWDIREVVHQDGHRIHWEQLHVTAEKWGISHAVFVTFSLANDMVEAKIPEHLLNNMRSEQLSPHIKAWAMEQMVCEPFEKTSYSPYFWQLFVPGSFREKLKSLTQLVFPPPEFVSQKYPAPFRSWRNYFYYLIRLKEHVRQYARALWRIVTHDPTMLAILKQQRRNITMRRRLLSEKK